jgi:polar amino acid transport system substrate-binding protein
MRRAALRALWLAALLPAQAAPAAPAERAVIRVGMDTRSRPWAFVPGLDYSQEDFSKPPRISEAQLRQLEGVDIDFLKAFEGRLGASLRIEPAAWETIESGLLEGRFDMIVNAWTPTSRMSEQIVASDPYYEWGLLPAGRADDKALRSYRDLAGRSVGHYRHPTIDRSVTNLGAKRLVPFDDSDQLFEALAAGSVDAVIEDSTYVRWRAANDTRFKAVGEPMNRHGYHVALRRSDAELLQRVQKAIRELVAAGEPGRIRKRWEAKRP